MLPLFVGGMLFSAPIAPHALAADPPADPSTENAAQYLERVWKDAPATLTRCSESSSVTISSYYCGGVAEIDSSVSFGLYGLTVPYKKGDRLQCYIPNGPPVCKVTTAAGAVSYVRGDFSGATQTCDSATSCSSSGAVANVGKSLLAPITNAVADVGQQVLGAVGGAILHIATFILGIAGVLFNLVVVKTVFQFSQLIGNSPGLLLAWGILRDLGNMVLLFGFIFMGLATILDLHTYNAKKALPPLIIFAVLMNFSLFAAEAIIDTSNVFSTILYSQANSEPCGGFSGVITGQTTSLATAEANDANCSVNYGIGGSIMQASGLSTMFKINSANLGIPSIAVYVGLALFATIGAIVMLAASIMLVIRAVTLTLLMVFAPIGFAGMAIPPLHGLASRWWSTLLHQAFFAPLLLLLIFISLKVTERLGDVGGDGLAGALTAPDTSTMGVILIFVIVIGFLIGSLKAASSFGAMGASYAISTAQSIIGKPLGALSSVAGRNTFGRGAAALQKQYESRLGHNLFVKNNVLGLDTGVASAFSSIRNAKFGGSTSFDASEKHHKERHKEFDRAAAGKKVRDATNNASMAAALKGVSEAQLAELGVLKAHGPKLDLIAKNLSPEMFEKMMNNKEIDESAKIEMRDFRFGGAGGIADQARKAETAAKAFADDPANTALKTENDLAQKNLSTAVNRLSAKDFGQIAQSSHADILKNGSLAAALSEDLFKEAKKNNNLTDAQRSEFDTARTARLSDPIFVSARLKGMNREAIGKIPGEAIVNAEVLNEMTGSQLAFVDPGKLTDAQQTIVKNHINSLKASGDPHWNDFRALLKANPKVKEYWKGIIKVK
ncbi:MAG: hypothetical protein ABIT47_01975 [Candidatus Paceibacterota bacterium]